MDKHEKNIPEEHLEIPQGKLIKFVASTFEDDYGFDELKIRKVQAMGLFDNKEFVSKLVGINGQYLKYASKRLKNDREIVMKAMKKFIDEMVKVYGFASKSMQGDPEILKLYEKRILEESRERLDRALDKSTPPRRGYTHGKNK
jgi:hypothetical protein